MGSTVGPVRCVREKLFCVTAKSEKQIQMVEMNKEVDFGSD